MAGVHAALLRVEWVEGRGWLLPLPSLLVRWLTSACDESGAETDDRTHSSLAVTAPWSLACGSKRFTISLTASVISFYYSRPDRQAGIQWSMDNMWSEGTVYLWRGGTESVVVRLHRVDTTLELSTQSHLMWRLRSLQRFSTTNRPPDQPCISEYTDTVSRT